MLKRFKIFFEGSVEIKAKSKTSASAVTSAITLLSIVMMNHAYKKHTIAPNFQNPTFHVKQIRRIKDE